MVNSGQVEGVGGPRSLKIIEMSSSSPLAWNSGSFRRSSANMQPTDQMSTAVEYSVAPNRISGALGEYGRVVEPAVRAFAVVMLTGTKA